MPVLTRSVSATSLRRPQLTPQTPPSTRRRAFVEMTPLPSLLDKMFEAANRSKRSNSLQLKSKVDDDPFVLSPIAEEPEQSSSCPIEDCDVQLSSDTPTVVEDEPEIAIYQPSVASDRMDYEDTPMVFSGPFYLNPPPASIIPPSAPASPLIREEVITDFLPHNPIGTYLGPPVSLPPTNHEPLLLAELTNMATSSHIIYYAPPISVGLDSNPPPQEQAPSQPLEMREEPLQIQVSEHITVYPQYPTPPPVLAASAPAQHTMEPVVLPALAHTLPAIPTFSGPYPQRQEKNRVHVPLAEASHRASFVPQIQPRQELENPLVWWFQSRPRVSRWRIREMERQKEMDRIAEPYITRLREVSRQRKTDGEARALSGQQRIYRTKGEPADPLSHLFGDEDKKVRKRLKEIELGKDTHEARRCRRSADGVSREIQETEGRRKSSHHRPKPYTIPHPATRSPRRLHAMPGGLDSDDLTWDQTGFTPDVLWEGLRSAVGVGYRLLAQG